MVFSLKDELEAAIKAANDHKALLIQGRRAVDAEGYLEEIARNFAGTIRPVCESFSFVGITDYAQECARVIEGRDEAMDYFVRAATLMADEIAAKARELIAVDIKAANAALEKEGK